MRYDEDVKLLENLIMIPSPSGYEREVAEFIKKEALKYVSSSQIEIDFHNNVIVTFRGKLNRTIMIDAHQDVLGFLINNIDKEGYISVKSIGGHDLSLLKGRRVSIITSKGLIKGVIGTKPIHLIESETDEIPERTTDVTLDIGIRRKNNVLSQICVGDPVILQPEFDSLTDNYYTGSGFDDKAGCFLLLKTIQHLSKNKCKLVPTVKFVFSVQEEIGCRGAKELVYKYKPDLFIGVDVTFATDQPDVDERRTGRCVLEEGVAIYKGINIHKDSTHLLTSIAIKNEMKIQYLATSCSGGTNATSIANMCGGMKILDIGIPLRNMHSQVEIINMKDLYSGSELLYRFLTHKNLNETIKK